MNRVTLIGRVSKEVAYQTLPSTTLCKFTVTTAESFLDKLGKERVSTEYHRITAWGKVADTAKFLKDGALVAIEGKIKTDKYTDKQGVEKYATGIQAASVEHLEAPAQSKKEPSPFDFGAGDDVPF